MKLLLDIGLWLINSRLGQILLLSMAIVAAILLTYWTIDHRAYRRGELACQSAHMGATAIANQKQAREEQAQRVAATEIAKDSDTKAAETIAETTNFTHKTKEVIRDAYRNPPKSKPLPGSCARPLDAGVQQRLDEAVDRANRAGSPLSATGNPTDQQGTGSQGLGRSVRPAERSGRQLDIGSARYAYAGTFAQADRTRLLE